MHHITCDRTGADLPESEASILRVSGPLRSMTGRSELHLGKPAPGGPHWPHP